MRKHRFSPLAERLEPRRLLAFSVFNPKTGQVHATATSDDDVVTVALSEQAGIVEITINGVTETHDKSGVRSVVVDALAGDDQVSITWAKASLVMGGDGNDSIIGVGGSDTFQGGAGSDTLDGGGGLDLLSDDEPGRADEDDDQIFGRGGDDQLACGGGNDLIDGGSGEELLDFSGANDALAISLDGVANDGVLGANPTGNLLAIESLIGGQGADLIFGDGGSNSLDAGNSENDTVFGQGGADTLTSRQTTATLDGGSGDDSIFNYGGSSRGQSGNDHIFIQSPGDVVADPANALADGGSGNDTVEVLANAVTARGQSGDDTINCQLDPNDPTTATGDFAGGTGADSLNLQLAFVVGDDVGYQITFDDQANDSVRGAAGGTMNFRSDLEHIVGTPGDDTLSSLSRPNRTLIDGADGNDSLVAGNFADTLEGGEGNDTLVGGPGENVLRGKNGNDTIDGGAGLDSFNGGPGNDQLNAADGEKDTLNGQDGTDTAHGNNGLDILIDVEVIN